VQRTRVTASNGVKLRNAAIILLHSLGFTPKEIGDLFGLAEGTVQNIYYGQGPRVMMSGHYIDTGEAARLLGVHVNTVRRWADAGKLPSVRLGNRRDRRFRREALERFLTRGGQ